MDGKEIEIKLKLNKGDYDRVLKLMKETAIFKKEKHQVDVYYSPQEESFYDCGDRCLRIRTEEDKSIISYKRIYNENTSDRFIEEYETEIADSQMMDSILKAINYQNEICVDKYRMEFYVNTGFLVALDKVEDLGFFIEIENKNESDVIEKRNQDLIKFVEELQIDILKRNTEGYSNMMYRKNNRTGD